MSKNFEHARDILMVVLVLAFMYSISLGPIWEVFAFLGFCLAVTYL